MIARVGVVAVAVVVAGSGCKYRQLPQRTVPAQLPPSIDPPTTPPGTDLGRVFVDVEDGTSTVSRVTKIEQEEQLRTGAGFIMMGTVPIVVPTTVTVDVEKRSSEVLCTTPCWIDLPLGKSHLISITGMRRKQSDLISLAAGKDPVAYRHALGRHDELDPFKRLPGALVLGLGAGLLVTFPLLLLADPGATVLLIWGASGVAGTVLGGFMINSTRAIQQDGAGVRYALPPVTATH